MRHISLRALAVFILLLAHMAVAGELPNRVTILYDALRKSPTLTKWIGGFAALIEYGGKRILFDTATMPKPLTQREAARASICKSSICDYVPPPR